MAEAVAWSGVPAIAGRAAGNLGRALRDAALVPFAATTPRSWISIGLERGVGEVAPTGLLASLQSRPLPLPELLELLGLAAKDRKVHGVAVRVGRAGIGWARIRALARGFAELRTAGKKLVVYAENTGNAGAWLGALADQFWMAPEGRLDLFGVRVESYFLRRALDRIGVRPEVISAGRYKSAGEMFSHDAMSEPAREALEALVEELYGALVEGLAAGRAGSLERAREWIDGGPYVAAEAREAGIVDALVYPDELPARLAALGGAGGRRGRASDEVSPLGGGRYLRLARPRFEWRPVVRGAPLVAVVPLLGLIRPGSASPRGVVGALRRLERLDAVRAVVLRIDSPGGDSLASDLLWRAVGKLAAKKPVVASLGDRAASGGYYVAMAAKEIFAESTTLTGSIGVVLISLQLREAAEALGVRSEAISRGKHAGIFDPLGERTAEERRLLRRQVEQTYDAFVKKAAADRGLSEAELHEVAEGRVWTGRAASEHRLVDWVGGLDEAVARAAELAGIAPGEARRLAVSPQLQPLDRLLRSTPFGAAWGAWQDAREPLRGPQLLCPIQIPLH